MQQVVDQTKEYITRTRGCVYSLCNIQTSNAQQQEETKETLFIQIWNKKKKEVTNYAIRIS